MKRASCRAGASSSPPTDWRIARCAAVSVVGVPSLKRRTRNGALRPRMPFGEPTMSLLSIPSMSIPAFLAALAKCPEP